MCRFLGQLKLCSTTNRWEPFTGFTGASITLERHNAPGLAPTGVSHTPGAASQPEASRHRQERKDTCPKAGQGSPTVLLEQSLHCCPAQSRSWGASSPAPVQMEQPSTVCSQPFPEHCWDQMSCTGDSQAYLSSETGMNLHHVQTLISDYFIWFFPFSEADQQFCRT